MAANRTDEQTRRPAWITWLLVAAIAVIAAVPLAVGAGDHFAEPFPASDERAENAVGDLAPDYEPWREPVFEAPSAEIESGLFALQAAIGAGIIGYYFGVVRTRARPRGETEPADGPRAAPTASD